MLWFLSVSYQKGHQMNFTKKILLAMVLFHVMLGVTAKCKICCDRCITCDHPPTVPDGTFCFNGQCQSYGTTTHLCCSVPNYSPKTHCVTCTKSFTFTCD